MAVMTVHGPVGKQDLGITLPHEHLFIDFRMIYEAPTEEVNRLISGKEVNLRNLRVLRSHPFGIMDNLLIDSEDLVLSEIMEFKNAGGTSIVDQTSEGLGQNPEGLRRVASAAGLNLIVGCGYYIRQSLAPGIIETSQKELVRRLVRDITVGVRGTNIRPGLIGEIGISNEISDWEEKVIRVVAEAQKETRLPISIHIQAVPTVPGFKGMPLGIEVLSRLEKAGADLRKVMISHTDAQVDLGYTRAIIDAGAFAEFDHVGKEFYIESSDFLLDRDADRMAAVRALDDSGHGHGLLISQDVCLKTDLVAYGGSGYAHILLDLVPHMRRLGVREKTIEAILFRNPAEFLDVPE